MESAKPIKVLIDSPLNQRSSYNDKSSILDNELKFDNATAPSLNLVELK